VSRDERLAGQEFTTPRTNGVGMGVGLELYPDEEIVVACEFPAREILGRTG
jgi:hypothetical protein